MMNELNMRSDVNIANCKNMLIKRSNVKGQPLWVIANISSEKEQLKGTDSMGNCKYVVRKGAI